MKLMIVLVLARGIRHPGSVVAAKIIAIYYGMLFASHGAFNLVRVYSNSSLAIQAVTSSSEILDLKEPMFLIL